MIDKPVEVRKILSKNLKEQRNKLGYTQEKLAEISGLSIQTINDIEGGRKWLSDKTISKLATALHIECYQLLVPDLKNQNKNEIIQTRQILGLMKKLKKNIMYQIEENFIDFLKASQ
ncbi:MAG: helix-turn-helix transcriptional regulator [Treponema sp.]|nr:helix-turn-helix transcriptional regulator [Treponema sp.]